MEEILNKLSEIETTAKKIMEDANKRKLTLSAEMEAKCREFDEQLEKETETQIQKIRQNLEQEKDERLQSLKSNTEKAFVDLDSYYEKNHEQLVRELFEKIIEP